MRALQLLLLFKPASLLAHWAGTNDIFVFASSALAIIPLAKLLGEATEVLAEKTGPRIGGLLNVHGWPQERQADFRPPPGGHRCHHAGSLLALRGLHSAKLH